MSFDQKEMARISKLLDLDLASTASIAGQIFITPENLAALSARPYRCSMNYATRLDTSLGRLTDPEAGIQFDSVNGQMSIFLDQNTLKERLLVEIRAQLLDQTTDLYWLAFLDPYAVANGVATLDPNSVDTNPPVPQRFFSYYFVTQSFDQDSGISPEQTIEIRLNCRRPDNSQPTDGFIIQSIKITSI